MDLKNNYKAIYKKIVEGKYKLVYEKGGRLFGSKSGIPAKDDPRLDTVDEAPAKIEAAPVAHEEYAAPVVIEEIEPTTEDVPVPAMEVKEEPKKRTSRSSKQPKVED